MNTELKPGMMALVIGSDHCEENIGKIFEVSSIDSSDSTALVVSEDVVGLNKEDGIKAFYGHSWFHLKHLLPIKPQADTLHTKEEQHASA